MPRIPDKTYLDFSGGIRRDKSPFLLKDNELQDGRNFLIDEQGRIMKRLGMQAFGQLGTSLFNAGSFFDANSAATNNVGVYAADTSSNVYLLETTNLTNAVTADQVTDITLDAALGSVDSGTFEIEGDIITFTGRAGTTYSGISGVTSAHAVGAPVHMWVVGSGVTTGSRGVYFATLNDNILLNSSDVFNNADRTAAAFSNSASAPVVLFLATFKSRTYGAGDGSASGQTTRVFYSALNDGTSWTPANDYFDVEDSRNEPVIGFKEYAGNFIIFKPNSMLRYNLASLRQTNAHVGAYNHFVPQEINGLLYTFCPRGIFVTNGVSSRSIGEPVKEYWKNFLPAFNATVPRIVTNTSAGHWRNYYLLYVSDVIKDDATTMSDVVLAYHTIKKNWTVLDGFTDLINFINLDVTEDNEDQEHFKERLFFTSTSLGMYEAFENRTLDGTTVRGGDLLQNMFRDTGTPITMQVKTKPYDLGFPNYHKQFGYLKVFSERPGMHISYQIDDQDVKPLGLVNKQEKRFKFPADAKGTRCALYIDESSSTVPVVYNGHVFEETSIISRRGRVY